MIYDEIIKGLKPENVHMNEEIMNRITTLNSSAFSECK